MLGGRSVHQWVEQVVNDLLSASGDNIPPIQLKVGAGILLHRRITRIEYNKDTPVDGQLIESVDGFKVILPVFRGYTKAWLRLVLAHEIAHSLFYNIRSWPPKPILSVGNGDADIERLCWLVARSLLIPSNWLREYIAETPRPGQNLFSLQLLYSISRIAQVPWRTVAQRLIGDTGLWNCILLLFESGINAPNGQPSWQLVWHIVSPQAGRVFIPIGHSTSMGRKYPHAHGELNNLLLRCSADTHYSSVCIQVTADTFRSISGIKKALYSRWGGNVFPIYISGRGQQSTLFSGNNDDQPNAITVCIPL